MRVVEGAGDVSRVCKRLVERQPPFRQSSGQRVAFEAFHDEEIDIVMASDVVEGADVRVRERGNGLRFSRKPHAHLRIECDSCRQDFDCHQAIEAGVRGTEDLTHASGAEAALYAIGTKRRPATNVRTIREQGRGCGPHATDPG